MGWVFCGTVSGEISATTGPHRTALGLSAQQPRRDRVGRQTPVV